MSALDYLDAELAGLKARCLLRDPTAELVREQVIARAHQLGVDFIDASSNDYLGLAAGLVSRETLAQSLEPGAGASPLIHGRRGAHRELEDALAGWTQCESALLFSSGYAANVGVISALIGADDLVVSDRLNHASIIDGCRLSRARTIIVNHNDVAGIERALKYAGPVRRRWVVTESYFSMDGDGPDLQALRAVCDRYDAALIVDEAHALGLFGPQGGGRCAEAGIAPDVLVGTLGKAVGTQGAFVAGRSTLRTWLWNRARSFVFSTGSSPVLALLTHRNLDRVRANEDWRIRLLRNAQLLADDLRCAGLNVPLTARGPIIPVIVGSNQAALNAAEALAADGILAQAIRPPTVPDGTARLRITISAQFGAPALERLKAALVRHCQPSVPAQVPA